jgi:hypothetical protein
VPGISVGDNPETNLTWTAIGYDPRLRQYPLAQQWLEALNAETRTRAMRLQLSVAKLCTLRNIQSSAVGQQLVTQIKALVTAYSEGILLHGPLLAYCYITGGTFYTHVEPGHTSFLMPKHRLEQAGAYDCYEHVEVALRAIERLVQEFGCLEVPTVDVRGSTALKPASNDFEQANLSKVSRFFGRCSMESALPGYEVAYNISDYLKMREFEYLQAEHLHRHKHQFFLDENEHVAFFATGKWQYFWAFRLNERGNLTMYKIAGHKTFDGQFVPNARPELRRVAFSTFDGGPSSFIGLAGRMAGEHAGGG